jgi:hypothetical protein
MLKNALISFSLLASWVTPYAMAADEQGKLPKGSYQFAAIDASGSEIGRSIKVDIPFNDPNVAVFAICGRRGAVEVAAKNDEGKIVAQTKCNGQ